jgi:hypothetical protein
MTQFHYFFEASTGGGARPPEHFITKPPAFAGDRFTKVWQIHKLQKSLQAQSNKYKEGTEEHNIENYIPPTVNRRHNRAA